ncbi:MAG: TIGR03936 family radical SAM-associated protein [Egibacteraceae bacterium]
MTAGCALDWICSTRPGTYRSPVRVRVRYKKSGKLRFISAIDLGRVWERALRKADLPIAFSEGFTPHPKISFADALPLGYASTGEYAELAFALPVALDRAVGALNVAFPQGLAVLDAVEVAEGAPKLATWLRASCWDVAYPEAGGLGHSGSPPDPPDCRGTPPDPLAEAVDAVRAAEALPATRERKGLPVTIDLRPAIHQIFNRGACVRVTLHHLEPLVRPLHVHLALRSFHPGLPNATLYTRVAQGTPVDEGLIEVLSGQLVPPHPEPTPPESARHLSAPGRLT